MKSLLMRLLAVWTLATAAAAGSFAGTAGTPPPLRVIDVAERTYRGAGAIAVQFSQELDPSRRYDAYLRVSDPQAEIRSAWVLADNRRTLYFPYVEPQTEYTVTILPGLPSAAGAPLSERVTRTVATRPLTPVVSFAGEGLLLPADMHHGLPVITVNVSRVDIDFFRLNERGLLEFTNWADLTGKKGWYKLSKLEEFGEPVYSGRFDLAPERNRRVVRHIPLDEIEALAAPGVYTAVMRRPGEYGRSYHNTHFLVTDIGLHARVYAGTVVVAASSLETASPLPGARLTVYDDKGVAIQEGSTDAHGLCLLKGRPSTKKLIRAEHDGQMGILPLEGPALETAAMDSGTRAYRPLELFHYSPRDLALGLALLVEHGVEGNREDEFGLALAKTLRSRSWTSTQEKYALFRAGLALERRQQQTWQARVLSGG